MGNLSQRPVVPVVPRINVSGKVNDYDIVYHLNFKHIVTLYAVRSQIQRPETPLAIENETQLPEPHVLFETPVDNKENKYSLFVVYSTRDQPVQIDGVTEDDARQVCDWFNYYSSQF